MINNVSICSRVRLFSVPSPILSSLLSSSAMQRRRVHELQASRSPSTGGLLSPQSSLHTVVFNRRKRRHVVITQRCSFLSTIHTTSSINHSTSSILRIRPEIQEALENHYPIVALESTIVTHGLPYPQNLELALQVEDILRQESVIAATIAVQNGVPCIGLSALELQDLAQASLENRATKVSTRELPLLMVSNSTNKHNSLSTYWGATTVASTMRLAYLAGISTFVTGGIGGVHRHGELTMDVSADLQELSRTPVIVVSAGMKSILDIAKTLEVLETLSVPVYTWQSSDFPAFFSPTSGLPSPARVDTAEQVAKAFHASRTLLQLPSGILVAVPNPEPTAGQVVEDAIQEALEAATQQKIYGKDVTPFILRRVAESTEGASMQSNIALVKHNATVGAHIAKAIASTSASSSNDES